MTQRTNPAKLRPGFGRGAKPKAPDTGKLTAQPAGRPGSGDALVSLRRFLPRHSLATDTILRALSHAFFRHRGIYQSDGGFSLNPSLNGNHRLPPAAPHPGPRTRREDHALLIVPMSSDRLFLDRVGRHQRPSPLHRHTQINMHSSKARAKGDISTLPGTRHFYFALTQVKCPLDRAGRKCWELWKPTNSRFRPQKRSG
jgi:hypothetical protein